MNASDNFNIKETLIPTNKDLVVAFQPAQNTVNYSYQVYKDNKIIDKKEITGNTLSQITLNQTGTYQIKVITNDGNTQNSIQSGLYIIDKTAPIIKVEKTNVSIKKGQTPKINVKAIDNYDGDVSSNLQNNIQEINFNIPGTKQLTYTVSDEAGNTATKQVELNVTSTNGYTPLFVTLIILIFTLMLYFFGKGFKSIKLDKRIARYVVKPINDNYISFADRFLNIYHKTTKKMTKSLEKTYIANKIAKRMDKYAVVSQLHNSGMEIVAGKFLTSLSFLAIALLTQLFRLKLITSYEILMPLVVGFFIFDILYFIKYKIYRKRLENDLLSAIQIMNNAFKSGRSITQAIEIVEHEMDGDISREFGKMSLELTYGLDITTVFKRLANRLKIEEVNYLTASLTILNKTGGNIIEVFSSIEKSLFNKKKLRLELRSLTGASRIIIWVLFVVPFVFALTISLINPSYFVPLYTTHIGIALTIGMIIYYLIFIFCVRKIMKVVI